MFFEIIDEKVSYSFIDPNSSLSNIIVPYLLKHIVYNIAYYSRMIPHNNDFNYGGCLIPWK